jgi:hypothetical protein
VRGLAVAGAGVALLARWLLGPQRTPVSVLVGVTAAGVVFAVFLQYQKWRFKMFDAGAPRAREENAAARMRG